MPNVNYHALSEQVQQYAQSFFKTHDADKFVYHNLAHTQQVVAAATQIVNHYQLEERDFFVVYTAAWFHDIGYFIDPTAHEQKGAEAAESFLKGTGVDDGTISAIKKCIIATVMPQSPGNLLEQIVCDADLFHLGTDKFSERNKLMRKEAEIVHGKEISKSDWRKSTIQFIENHHYFTDYCRLLLEERQRENLQKLKLKNGDILPAENSGQLVELINRHIDKEEMEEEEKNKPNQKEKNKKSKNPERGIDTIFRITSSNNQKLSSQADSKAHIMIQVNSIIVSVLLSVLFRRLEEYRFLTIPAILLLAVNLVTIIFSVLATRPQIPKGTFNKADIDNKTVNLLFFGNFYKMSLEDYASGMLKMMEEYDFLYGSLIRDVYFQGKVLGRKYHLLRISYNVFMYGLVVAVIGFVIALVFFGGR